MGLTDDHITPGAIRAATAICERMSKGFAEEDFPAGGVVTFRDVFARVIDQQSGLKELLEACEACWKYWQACADSAGRSPETPSHAACHEARDHAELARLADQAARLTYAALAKAKGD